MFTISVFVSLWTPSRGAVGANIMVACTIWWHCHVSFFPCPPGAGGVTLPTGTLVCYDYKWVTIDGDEQHCDADAMGTTQCNNETDCYRRVLAPGWRKTIWEYGDRVEVNHAPARLTAEIFYLKRSYMSAAHALFLCFIVCDHATVRKWACQQPYNATSCAHALPRLAFDDPWPRWPKLASTF